MFQLKLESVGGIFIKLGEILTMEKQKIIALTGPIAAGKNAVADILSSQGYPVIDADLVAHRAINKASATIYETFKTQAEELGLKILNDDGTINRRNLAPIIFSKPENILLQEKIVHPLVDEMLQEFIDEHKEATVIINATVLYKSEIMKQCSAIFFVTAWQCIRFFRIKKRNNLPAKEIFARFLSQKNIFAKYKKINADIYVIRNNFSRKKLTQKVLKVISQCEQQG